MEFNDYDCIIYIIFKQEFHLHSSPIWNEFILEKNIGLVYYGNNRYRIVDEKKWMLTKIKYGI